MSIFSGILGWLEGLAGSNPQASAAASAVQSAESAVLAAVEPLADDLLNAVLERIPLAGEFLTGPGDALLNSFLDKLLGKLPQAANAPHNTALARIAPRPQNTPPVTMQPIEDNPA